MTTQSKTTAAAMIQPGVLDPSDVFAIEIAVYCTPRTTGATSAA